MSETSVGEALIGLLQQRGVEVVFGIPGVHTVELYRGLDRSAIRHITPRHEQGAAFMADGYARVTGKPGVCLLITGPGFTNAITAIAQARADSVPMLVISGVNARDSLSKQLGHLHELPDQAALSRSVCLKTFTLLEPDRLGETMAEAFEVMTSGRPGPVHIEIPTDVMALKIDPGGAPPLGRLTGIEPTSADLDQAQALTQGSHVPLIMAGGGMKDAAALQALATALDAPVVSTTNARGLMAGHGLNVPASPSLHAIRRAIDDADLVIALGTELGETDYDFFGNGPLPALAKTLRVDIDPEQLKKRDDQGLMIEADAASLAATLADRLTGARSGGAERARQLRDAALLELPADYRSHVELLHAIWQQMPEAIIVGDSTQAVYAGTLYLDVPSPRAWFNSGTGYGTLGYAAPAAIGAALGAPGRPVICLIGDGGLQFTLGELGSAVDCGADVLFLVWNNQGYREIESSMVRAGVTPIGVKPSAPDFKKIAEAYRLQARRVTKKADLAGAMADVQLPALIDFFCP